jgi:hypothetical protein
MTAKRTLNPSKQSGYCMEHLVWLYRNSEKKMFPTEDISWKFTGKLVSGDITD